MLNVWKLCNDSTDHACFELWLLYNLPTADPAMWLADTLWYQWWKDLLCSPWKKKCFPHHSRFWNFIVCGNVSYKRVSVFRVTSIQCQSLLLVVVLICHSCFWSRSQQTQGISSSWSSTAKLARSCLCIELENQCGISKLKIYTFNLRVIATKYFRSKWLGMNKSTAMQWKFWRLNVFFFVKDINSI